MIKSNNGFTLIELLVVIAIIGLLSSVVLASLNSARVKSRDAKRRADLQQLSIALEFYFDAHDGYPADVVSNWENICTVTANSAGELVIEGFMPVLPCDPINSGSGNGSLGTGLGYFFDPDGTCIFMSEFCPNYCIYANLEGGGRYAVAGGGRLLCL